MRSGYDPRLSGLRGLAALMVVLVHIPLYGSLPVLTSLLGADVETFYSLYANGFWIGVPVFLMLSILLLLRSLGGNSSLKHYFWRRVRRIWPIYFGSVILISTIFQSTYHLTLVDYLGFFTFTQYYTNPGIGGPLAVFWTLQLEEAVYLFIPLIHRSSHKEWIAYGLILTSVTWLVLLFNTQLLTSRPAYSNLWFLPPTWLMAYGLGILVYLGRLSGEGWKTLRWVAPMSLVLGGFLIPFQLGPIDQRFELFYLVASVAFAAVVANPPGFLRYLSVIGEGSYAMYATHIVFLIVFGLLGIPLVLMFSFCVEFVLRPKEISNRLNLPLFHGVLEVPNRGPKEFHG